MAYQVKTEVGIKPDPDAPVASPSMFRGDDDIYEETHDLEFNEQPEYQSLYLARVPKYLWEEWDKLDDDAEITLGTVRQSEVIVNGKKRTKLQMLLRSDLAAHQTIPKEYVLDITEEKAINTFVFTEQDLPGYKSRTNRNKPFDASTANIPSRLTRPKPNPSAERQPYDKNRKFTPYIRKAIPKKTILKGTVKHEVNCVAVDNAESRRIIAQKTADSMRAKTGTLHLTGAANDLTQGFINPGTIQSAGAFGGFIKNTPVTAKKSQEQKTARMPKNELLDLLWNCFREYKYWSMKALRAKLKQPEAYLREVLEEIADLPKSGKFAMNWTIKADYADSMSIKNEYEGSAPNGDMEMGEGGVEDEEMADDDDDEEDIKFEDAL